MRAPVTAWFRPNSIQPFSVPWQIYAVGLAAPLVACALRHLASAYWGTSLPFMFYFPAAIAAARFGGYKSGVIACALSVLLVVGITPPVWGATQGSGSPTVLGFVLFCASLVVITGVCGRLQATRVELEQEKERYRATLASIGDAVIATDREGRVRLMNAEAERLTGRTLTDFFGQPLNTVFRRFHDETREPAGDPVQAVMHTRKPVTFCAPKILVSSDQREYFIDESAAPIFRHAGDTGVDGVVVVFRDVTENRKAVQMLAVHARELEARVDERTRSLSLALRDMETFSYSVSHDLRAPLRAIRSYSQILRDDYGQHLDVQGHDLLDRIQRGADRLDRFTSDMLDYARVSAATFEPKPVDPGVLIRDVVGGIRQTAADKLVIRIDEPFPWVMGHEAVLQQALRNLIGNAAKFVVPGRQPVIHIYATVNGDVVRLHVDDNGIGIAVKDCARVFRMFERLRPAQYPGTGIGLTIAQRAMQRCGGKIGFESEVDRGSTFWIELPGAATPAPSATGPDEVVAPAVSKRRTDAFAGAAI